MNTNKKRPLHTGDLKYNINLTENQDMLQKSSSRKQRGTNRMQTAVELAFQSHMESGFGHNIGRHIKLEELKVYGIQYLRQI